ncbi:hypothetical protein HY486_01230 [Candidatus Woesearchaeota archaeon]|nr:hypothetical protein [Candidatus Woesearchaeota archaeon]
MTEAFIPWDKSWIIRMGMLDILNRYEDIIQFLDAQENLSDDIKALKRIASGWKTEKELNTGESATLYRFVQFACWKHNINKRITKQGTLKERNITNNPEIIHWTQDKLLTLDSGTSQWASAAVICGDNERIKNPPYKLQLTYDAVAHWKQKRNNGECWTPKKDATIQAQAKACLEILKTGKTEWKPQHSEDYCFARAFNLITPKEAIQKWPSLQNHESNRIQEMEETLKQANNNQPITSKDHRVIQAAAMNLAMLKQPAKIMHPESVNKSWPQFWTFIENLPDSSTKNI